MRVMSFLGFDDQFVQTIFAYKLIYMTYLTYYLHTSTPLTYIILTKFSYTHAEIHMHTHIHTPHKRMKCEAFTHHIHSL